LKAKLISIKNSQESETNTSSSFERVSNPEKFPNLKNVKQSFESYFGEELSPQLTNLSPKEKENVKTILWGKFLNIFSSESALGAFMNSLQAQVNNGIQSFQKAKKQKSL